MSCVMNRVGDMKIGKVVHETETDMNLSYHVAGLFEYQRNYCSVFVGYVILLYRY